MPLFSIELCSNNDCPLMKNQLNTTDVIMITTEIEEYRCDKDKIKLSELLFVSKMVSSKNEARRLIEQGGAKVNNEKVTTDTEIEIKDGIILQAGKRKFKKIVK